MGNEVEVKKISEQEEFEGFDLITSILLRDNAIDPNNFVKLFPDIMLEKKISINTFLREHMKPLKEQDKFIEFVKKNYGKKVCLITDYDVDGIFATVILKLGLEYFGFKDVIFCIPKRIDSYGLSNSLIDRALSQGAEVIITADNGVSAKEAVEYAKEKGLEILITDHHLPTEGCVPEGVPIIDPKYNGDEFSGICGAYVAFKLIYSLFTEFSKDKINHDIHNFLAELLTYAGIATISDLMPMLNENRLLAKVVMDYIDDIKCRELFSLRVYKIINAFGGRWALNDPEQIFNEETVSFGMAPFINSISRLGNSVEETVREICELDMHSIYKNNYQKMNKERQRRTRVLAEKHQKTDDPVSVEILDTREFEWEIDGLVGLMVSRITSDEHKPAMVGIVKPHRDTGELIYSLSARSTLGYSIYDGVMRIKEAHPELGIDGGGHASAMGLTLKKYPGSLEAFRKYICEDYVNNKTDRKPSVYEMEMEYVEYCISVFDSFRFFGSEFNKIKFTYTGRLSQIFEQNLYIDNYKFISYSDTSKYQVGKTYKIIFNINLGYRSGAYFTIASINEVE